MCPARDVRVARLSRVAAVVLALQLAAAPVHVGGCSKPDRLAPSSNCTAPLSLNMRGGTGDWPWRKRSRPVVALHLSHGGGEFVCKQALLNCEAASHDGYCACSGDTPREHPRVRTCASRIRLLERNKFSFVQMERGFEDGEFCPQAFDYVLILRDPMERMNSYASKYASKKYVNRLTEYVSFGMLMDELRKGKGADRGLNEYGKVNWPTNGGHAEGLTNFDNVLVRFAAGRSATLHAPIGGIGQADFDAAVANLRKYAFVEPLSPNTKVHEAPLRWPVWESKPSNHHANHAMNTTHLAALAAINKWDLKLWDMVRSGYFGKDSLRRFDP